MLALVVVELLSVSVFTMSKNVYVYSTVYYLIWFWFGFSLCAAGGHQSCCCGRFVEVVAVDFGSEYDDVVTLLTYLLDTCFYVRSVCFNSVFFLLLTCYLPFFCLDFADRYDPWSVRLCLCSLKGGGVGGV